MLCGKKVKLIGCGQSSFASNKGWKRWCDMPPVDQEHKRGYRADQAHRVRLSVRSISRILWLLIFWWGLLSPFFPPVPLFSIRSPWLVLLVAVFSANG